MLKVFGIIFVLFIAPVSLAQINQTKIQRLLMVDNNLSDGTHSDLKLIVDASDEIIGIDWIAYDKIGAVNVDYPFAIEQLSETRKSIDRVGVVLIAARGVEVLLLRGKVKTNGSLAELTFSHVVDGIGEFLGEKTEYPDCKLTLKRDKSGKWLAINYKSQPVERATIMANKTGVTTIAAICPNEESDLRNQTED